MRDYILCIFIFAMCGCTNKYHDGFLCRYLYFQTSTNKNAFWVEVKENRSMKVTFGDITWACYKTIKHGRFPDKGIEWDRIKDKDSITVDSLTYKQLENLASEVRKRKSVNTFIVTIDYDAMGTVLFIKDKYYYVVMGDYKDKTTQNFIKKLRETSPIPIRASVGSVLQNYD